MAMLRKITVAFVVAAIISVCGVSQAAMKKHVITTNKYAGPLLRASSVYQIGENEFILKLSGRDLPHPECESRNDVLYITLNDTKAYHPERIISSVKQNIASVPVIYDFSVENMSDDVSFWSVVTVKANTPLEAGDISRSHDGWQLRVRSKPAEGIMPWGAYVPPPKMIPSPDTTLPFRVDAKITLDLWDAELREVIRGIMAHIGRNVIIDPSFPKKVTVIEETRGTTKEVRTHEEEIKITMSLNDVRADDVLNQFMRTYDLACYVSGVNTLTFGSREGLYKLSGQRSIKTFKLHFSEPEQVKTMLKMLAALEDSAVTADERMKALYVKTNPAKMQEVEELISILDTPQKQVMIQASIFEFSDNDSLEVGNALQVMYDDIRIALGPNDDSNGIAVQYRNDRSLSGTREVWTQRVVTGTFSALEQQGKGKVIANPSVIALDGKEAEINLTQDYPYVSDRDNQKGTVTWATEEVGPKLKFTPRVGRDGYVTLTLDISTGDVVATQTSSTGEQMPVTTTRSVKTDVRVRDGMPFVIGGLFREDSSKSIYKIPILGHIPLLGELFTSRSNSKTKSQVVMVVTPYILDSN